MTAELEPTLGGDVAATLEALRSQMALSEAAELARSGDYASAENRLAEWTQGQCPLAPAFDLRARMAAQQGRLAEAQALWLRALQIDPDNAAYAAGLRRAALEQGQRLWRRRLATAAVVTTLALTVVLVVGLAWRGARQAGAIQSALSSMADDVAAIGQRVDALSASDPAPVIQSVEASSVAPAPALAPAVQEALRVDAELGALPITVAQSGTAIYLAGTAPSAELVLRAVSVAKSVPGVELVDASGLQASVPSTATDLAAAVSRALAADERTAGLDVRLTQVGTSVRVTGAVPGLDDRAAIEAVAHGVAGVELVDTSAVQVGPAVFAYTVRPGDTLASIANLFYGDWAQWPTIQQANREAIPDANSIAVGLRIRVPVSAEGSR